MLATEIASGLPGLPPFGEQPRVRVQPQTADRVDLDLQRSPQQRRHQAPLLCWRHPAPRRRRGDAPCCPGTHPLAKVPSKRSHGRLTCARGLELVGRDSRYRDGVSANFHLKANSTRKSPTLTPIPIAKRNGTSAFTGWCDRTRPTKAPRPDAMKYQAPRWKD